MGKDGLFGPPESKLNGTVRDLRRVYCEEACVGGSGWLV